MENYHQSLKTDSFSKHPHFALGDLLREQDLSCLQLTPPAGSNDTQGSEKITVFPDVNPDLAQKIAGGIGLTFVPERESDRNLCMADSSEVLPEFRETCTRADVLNFVFGVLISIENSEKPEHPVQVGGIQIPYPQDVLVFWENVDFGRRSGIGFCQKDRFFPE